jgi:organic radical activating enzyme
MQYICPNFVDVLVTLRCNAKCKNCVELCNKYDDTGLDYSNSDLTLKQIDYFIEDIKSFNRKNFTETVCLTGGEALLHPNIEEIVFKLESLHNEGYFRNLYVASNLILEAPQSIKKYILNLSLPRDNPKIHQLALFHPKDYGGSVQTYSNCKHHRKDRVVLSYQGYSKCCAADSYIRLFGYEDLIVDKLPKSLDDFPNMDKICAHCPWGQEHLLPYERDIDYIVSDIYKEEANKNKLSKRICKRFGDNR